MTARALRRAPAAALPVALTLAAVATGCGRLPQTHYYLLEPPSRCEQRAQGTEGLDVGVRAFRVDPPYDQDRIVYRVGNASPEVGFYAYHRWAAPLSRMLPAIAAGTLRCTGGVRSIEPVAAGRRYPVYLEGRLLFLEEVDLADGQHVRVRLALTLRDDEGAELWSDTLEREGAASARTVGELVKAMSHVLNGLLEEARHGFASGVERAR